MDHLTLGSAGPEVSAFGLGCMGMSEFYGTADRDESLATLARARELGITFFDTADTYGIGENESLLGEFLRWGGHDEVVVATKFGPVRDPETRGLKGLRGDPTYVVEACDASLRRLGVDHIDLYYLHVPDPRTPLEDTVGAMAGLVAAGKVRHLGLSNLGAAQVRAAHAVHPITAVQNEWSLFSRSDEAETVPTCAELGIGYVPNCPLGRGLLSGAYDASSTFGAGDVRARVSRFAAEHIDHNLSLIKTVREIGEQRGATPAQVALAWLRQQGERHALAVVPIPGTSQRAWLEENMGAAAIRLTEDDLMLLEPLSSPPAPRRLPVRPRRPESGSPAPRCAR
jgi:aryl-alcohol dehydrogenase-like predicted oxidoreductase